MSGQVYWYSCPFHNSDPSNPIIHVYRFDMIKGILYLDPGPIKVPQVNHSGLWNGYIKYIIILILKLDISM